MSDDNSKLVPLLPISNRTVKRLCADDSVHYVCESRSSSDSLQSKKPLRKRWGFLLSTNLTIVTYLNEVTTCHKVAGGGVG